MNLNTIAMEPDAAKAAYEDYAAAVKGRRDAEDEAIALGYRALSEGKALINLPRRSRLVARPRSRSASGKAPAR